MTRDAAIHVDQVKCTRCGFCAEVCPSGIIQVQVEGPVLTTPRACIRCGHCVAICQHGALDHTQNSLKNQPEIKNELLLSAEAAEQFLRTRRSIRAYKPEQIPREDLEKLLSIARFAPTGGNSQGISYLLFSGNDVLKQVTVTVVEWLEEQVRNDVAWVKPYAGMAKIYRQTGYDVVLRSAPHLLVALAAAKNPIGRDNARFALTYIELYAQSLGLGSCWAGFFEMAAFSGYGPLLNLLGIPEGKAVASALMIGKPKYTYRRMADRNALEVIWR